MQTMTADSGRRGSKVRMAPISSAIAERESVNPNHCRKSVCCLVYGALTRLLIELRSRLSVYWLQMMQSCLLSHAIGLVLRI